MWLTYFTLFLSVYCIGNAVLHDVFVLRKHQGGYNRDLLRLLMDGHILLTAGAFYLLAGLLMPTYPLASYLMCIISSLSLITYCLMIYVFLKSIVTLSLNIIMLVVCIWHLWSVYF